MPIHLENLQSEAFSDGLSTEEPISFYAISSTKEEQEEEAKSLAAAKEISMGAAAAAVLSQLDACFKLNSTEDFSQWERCFGVTADRLWQEFRTLEF